MLGEEKVCSPDPTRECGYLPLLFVGSWDLPVNLANQAPAGEPFTLRFQVRRQPGQTSPSGVRATVEVSYDGGQTWTGPAEATSTDGTHFESTITHPDLASTNGYVSLRVRAEDASGNTVTQTLGHAYSLTQP
jgi:hypothetical protein